MSKIIVPCDVWVKRMYRMYVETDDDATEDEIRAKAIDMLTDGRDPDSELCLDQDFELEAEDICFVNPDMEGSFSQADEEELAEILEDLNNGGGCNGK